MFLYVFCDFPQVVKLVFFYWKNYHKYLTVLSDSQFSYISFLQFFQLTTCYTFPDQVMAIATLSSCYNNPMLFQGVVKIRKGQAVTLMMEATSMSAVQTIISQYSQEVGVFLLLVAVPSPPRWSTLTQTALLSLSADLPEGLSDGSVAG